MALGFPRFGRRAGPERAAPAAGVGRLERLIDDLPADLRRRALTHSSWVPQRVSSYGRLAFLGDSVLGLAVAEHLFRQNPRADIGRLTKVHGQAVSGRACAAVAGQLGLPAQLEEFAGDAVDGGIDVGALLASERALASVCEAVIGACYLHHGFEATAAATVTAFSEEIALASGTLLDYKSALQERLARDGARVSYDVVREAGPAHDRRFDVEARVNGQVFGAGSGRSKKAAEQEAAARAMEALDA